MTNPIDLNKSNYMAISSAKKDIDCWTELCLQEERHSPPRFSKRGLIKNACCNIEKSYRQSLRNGFSQWRRWNIDFSPLTAGCIVQVKCPDKNGSRWLWGKIVESTSTYSVSFDSIPDRTFRGIPRNLIKPRSRLVRSGVVIDYNYVELPQKQRLRDKWGTRRSDFE